MAIANIDAVNMMKSITVTVKLKRNNELMFRLWVGRQLFKLAALVMNCNIKFEGAE